MNNILLEPTNYTEFVFGDKESEKLIDLIIEQKLAFPSFGKSGLILYGAFGTGKTCFANVFCHDFEKSISDSNMNCKPIIYNCDKTMAIDKILKQCNATADLVSFNNSGLHYFIFDEVDNLTVPAMRALKSFMNRKSIVCVLTTNYLNEIDKGVIDRCHLINFNMPPSSELIKRIENIINSNGLPALTSKEIQNCLSENGVWRDILPMLSLTLNKKLN